MRTLAVIRIQGRRPGAGVRTLGHHLAAALRRLGEDALFEDLRGGPRVDRPLSGGREASVRVVASKEPLPEETAVIWVLLPGDPLPEDGQSWLLFNRQEKKGEGAGERVLGFIPEEPCFSRAFEEGKDLFTLCPEGEGAKALLQAAARLQRALREGEAPPSRRRQDEEAGEPASFSQAAPKVNQKVVLRDEEGESYGSFVEEVEGSWVTVAVPMRRMVALHRKPGSPFLLEYGDGTAVFQFPAALVEVGPHGWRLQVEEKGLRRQRRRYLRWPVVLPVKVWWEGKALEGRTADISGGGLLAVLPQWIPVGKKVTVLLQLPEREIRGEARVVRELPRLPQGYRFGLEWQNLRMADEDAIVRFIFRQQQKARRQGLL